MCICMSVMYSICGIGSHNDQQMTTVREVWKGQRKVGEGGGAERKEVRWRR
jgi:hypothetical protein